MLSVLFFLQTFVELTGVASVDRIDDGPNDQISENKDCGKHHNGTGTPFQPIIHKIGSQIADIQDHAVDQDRHRQGNPFDLIEGVHAAYNEG